MRAVTVIARAMPGIAGPVIAAHRYGEQATRDGGGAEDEQNPAEREGHGAHLSLKPIKSGRAIRRKTGPSHAGSTRLADGLLSARLGAASHATQ
jgi:hypothetical protein